MPPQILKRWGSTTSGSKARKGRKGFLYVSDPEHPPTTPEEQVRITFRRHQKAERDERMDITMALTPVKTYMGGFTRPKDLRAGKWFPGGPYVQQGKVYESPPESAYEPHTVFLLETRYRVRHGIGRVDARDHITAVCRATDYVKLMAKYNSSKCPVDGWEAMDNANWPFVKPGKILKRTKWWGRGEKLEDIMREIYAEKYDEAETQKALLESEEEEDDDIAVALKQRGHARTEEKRTTKVTAKATVETTTKSSSSTSLQSLSPILPHDGGAGRTVSAHLAGSTPQRDNYIKDNPKLLRATYHKHIRTEPFWRPLLAVTFSTRPLALSVLRLAKSLERGLPFHAAMLGDDRKCLHSFDQRMRNLRLNRWYQLVREVTTRLAGYKGGFVGIRFNTKQRGRGVNGEGLADPIPLDKRIVKVQVGRWFERAEEVCDLYREGGLEWGGSDAVDVAFMTEWGRRLDTQGNEVPLTEEEKSQKEVVVIEDVEDAADAEDAEDTEAVDAEDTRDDGYELSNPWVRKRKLRPDLRGEDETAARLRKQLALQRAQRHRSVQHL